MLPYTKFLKVILLNKRKLEKFETITLLEECNIILKNKLPLKLKDLEGFSISCTIRNESFNKALCNLGVSISLMPFSIYESLDIR